MKADNTEKEPQMNADKSAKKLMCASWIIQPGQGLATGPERNSAYEEVTNHAKPEEW